MFAQFLKSSGSTQICVFRKNLFSSLLQPCIDFGEPNRLGRKIFKYVNGGFQRKEAFQIM